MNCKLWIVNCEQITVHYSARIMNSELWTLIQLHSAIFGRLLWCIRILESKTLIYNDSLVHLCIMKSQTWEHQGAVSLYHSFTQIFIYPRSVPLRLLFFQGGGVLNQITSLLRSGWKQNVFKESIMDKLHNRTDWILDCWIQMTF